MPNGDDIKWRKVEGGGFHQWDDGAIEGVYTHSEDGVPTQHGLRVIHHFRLEDGSLTKVWGNAGLDSRLAGLRGHLLRIERGKEKVKTGSGRSMWPFDVMDGGVIEAEAF